MEKLYEGNLFWKVTSRPFEKFNPVTENLETDVLIIGGGMSGNLCAYELASRNYSVILCEQDRLGMGSSLANTGMFQFSNDTMLTSLIHSIGEEKAVLFYRMCLESVNDLIQLNQSLEQPTGLTPRNSMHYAATAKEADKLEKEFKALQKHDFPVSLVNHNELMETYGVDLPKAIIMGNGAEVNPYKFLQSLIAKNVSLGVKYFENTEIVDSKSKKNYVIGITDDDHEIKAKHIILATGYIDQYREIRKKVEINRTYALVTTISKKPLWKDNLMFQDIKKPRLYFRTTENNQVVAGGMDEEKSRLVKNKQEIKKVSQKILKRIKKIYPDLDVEIECEWNALVGETSDRLPLIGPSIKHKHVFYLLGFGGNNVDYSMAGAKIIADAIEGKKNPYADLVKINRK